VRPRFQRAPSSASGSDVVGAYGRRSVSLSAARVRSMPTRKELKETHAHHSRQTPRSAWLDHAHHRGIPPCRPPTAGPPRLSDDDLLAKLLELHLHRAGSVFNLLDLPRPPLGSDPKTSPIPASARPKCGRSARLSLPSSPLSCASPRCNAGVVFNGPRLLLQKCSGQSHRQRCPCDSPAFAAKGFVTLGSLRTPIRSERFVAART